MLWDLETVVCNQMGKNLSNAVKRNGNIIRHCNFKLLLLKMDPQSPESEGY